MNARFRDKMRSLGLRDFTAHRLVAMKMLDVDADLIAELRGTDFRSISVERLLRRNGRGSYDHLDYEMREALESVVRDLTR